MLARIIKRIQSLQIKFPRQARLEDEYQRYQPISPNQPGWNDLYKDVMDLERICRETGHGVIKYWCERCGKETRTTTVAMQDNQQSSQLCSDCVKLVIQPNGLFHVVESEQ